MLLRLSDLISLTINIKLMYMHQTLDSPVIYGNRVETSNPYHLTYIDKIPAYISKVTSRLQAFFNQNVFANSAAALRFFTFTKKGAATATPKT